MRVLSYIFAVYSYFWKYHYGWIVAHAWKCHYGFVAAMPPHQCDTSMQMGPILDWCCLYGLNCLFKFDFCWITHVVEYLNQNIIIKKKKRKKNSEMPLELGQFSAISLMLPRQLDLVQVHVLTLSLSLS